MSKREAEATAKMLATLAGMRNMMGVYSIEGIAADGERPRAEQERMVREGVRLWRAAVKSLGRSPLWAEMYGRTGRPSLDSQTVEPEGLEGYL